MTIRKTIKWFTLLLFLGGMVAGAYGYKLWSESDELLRQQVLTKLKKSAPGWNFEIGKTRYVWPRRLYLYNIKLTSDTESSAILTVPQIIISVDRRALSEHQEILIEKIQVIGAHAELDRKLDGKWNWQSLPPLPPSDKSCPEWFIEHASVTAKFEQGNDRPPSKIELKNIEGHLVPSGKRKFLITVGTRLKDAGKLSVKGNWDLASKQWSIDGQLFDISSNGDLLNMLASVSPAIQGKLDQAKQDYGLHEDDSVQTSSNGLGITGRLELGFKVKKEKELSISCQARFSEGKIANPLLPFPLHDVSGSFFWENQKIEIKQFSARNGTTQFQVNGFIDKSLKELPGQFQVDIEHLPLDNRLKRCLKGKFLKLYSSFDPTGRVDITAGLNWDGKEKWTPLNLVMESGGCSFAHEKFPYRVQNVRGVVKQAKNRFHLELEGRAGQSPVYIGGYVNNPGPVAECDIDVSAERIKIDERFRAACKPEARKVIEDLRLDGLANISAKFYRPPGLNQKYDIEIISQVHHARVKHKHFPYQINELSGLVNFNSRNDLWQFQNLKGIHGSAEISGKGFYSKNRKKGSPFVLIVNAENAKLDRDLYQALPTNLQQSWVSLSPNGFLKLDARMEWGPGQPFDLIIPNAKVTNGSLTLKSFPFPVNNMKISFNYDRLNKKKSRYQSHDPKIIRIIEFSGVHNQTTVEGKNATITESDDSIWNVHFNNIRVNDLVSHDPLLRRVLPSGLKSVVNELNPKGNISFYGELDLKGHSLVPDEVNAAWDITTLFAGNTIQLGVEVQSLFGKARARGSYGEIVDSRKIVKLKGIFDFDSLQVWGYQLNQVKGPFSLDDQYVVVGSKHILRSRTAQNSSPVGNQKGRVTAKAIGGEITLDAVAILPVEDNPSGQKDTIYHVLMTLEQGELEKYARRYLKGQTNLRGTMKGWIDLHGRGSSPDNVRGKGQLLVKPAALLELPAIAQMMQRMSAPTPRNSAFQSAFADFNVENSQFKFKRISLVGDTITFIGRGAAGFNGRLNLDFYSQLPKTRTGVSLVDNIASPVIGQLFRGWIGVQINGEVNNPKTRIIPVPVVEDTMKQFLGVFNGRPRSVPNLLIPPLAPTKSTRRSSNSNLQNGLRLRR